METLLKMKHLVFTRGKFTEFTRGKFTTLRLNDFRMMHNMLAIFDELASQNTHVPLNDFLLTVFVERDDTLSHTKDYVSVVLFGTTLESEIGKDATCKVTITDYRVRAISHFEVCVGILSRTAAVPPPPPTLFYLSSSFGLLFVEPDGGCYLIPLWMIEDMIQKRAENQSGQNVPLSHEDSPRKNNGWGSNREYSPNSASQEHRSSSVEVLMKKLEFLLNPSSGYILQFLSQGSHYDNVAVKKHMLQLLCKIFELKGNPFVSKKSYVDAYVSYFYIRFIKLYQNQALDSVTIEFCQLYLRLLLAFSLCKTGMPTYHSYSNFWAA
jgi:hypothetical protein